MRLEFSRAQHEEELKEVPAPERRALAMLKLPQTARKKLETSWAPVFYEEFFRLLDEEVYDRVMPILTYGNALTGNTLSISPPPIMFPDLGVSQPSATATVLVDPINRMAHADSQPPERKEAA